MQQQPNWDYNSDQPYTISDRAFKNRQKRKYLLEYLQMLLLFIFIFPLSFITQFFLGSLKTKITRIGIGVNLDKGTQQYALVKELGVKYLLIRLPLWDIDNINDYVDFAKSFGDDKHILINVLQDRVHIDDRALLKKNIGIIFTKFAPIADEYQIGNAINRTKWGFFAVSEYLDFYKTVQSIRDKQFPQLKLIGPSVIDFEYYYTAFTLFNFRKIKFDKLSSLLYVDRRGAPQNRQYGYFDIKNKIKLLAAMIIMSTKTNNELYITEVNWPLENTAPFSPTSEAECVSEIDYASYMQDYINIASKTKWVSRIYWHQLIAPGYGLVDNRNGKIRKTYAFEVFKNLLSKQNLQ